MKNAFLCAALLCAASALHAEETPLFNMTTADRVFTETARGDESSTVEASAGTGSAVAKSMFLLAGSCALMKHRNKEAFTIEQLSKQPVRFTVRFVAADPAADLEPATPFKPGAPISKKRCALVEAMQAR